MAPKRSSRAARVGGFACIVAGSMLAMAGLAVSAGGEPGDPAPDDCPSTFEGGRDAQLTLTSDPEAPGPVAAGDEIDLSLSWPTDAWTSIDKIYLCVEVDGIMQPEPITYVEKPGDNDGSVLHSITVPEGSEEICVAGRVSGQPGAGNTSDDTHKSNILCFDVGDQQQPQVGSVTLDKVLAGEGAPDDDPSFTFSVACDSGTVPNAAPSIKASDAPLVVATDVAVGDSCTIVETGDSGADDVALAPDEDAGTAGAQVTITEDGQVIDVVATNTFDETPPATVAPNVVTPPAPVVEAQAAVRPAQVLGTQTTRELPRTGSGTTQLFFVGLGLVLMGGGLMANAPVAVRRS